MGAFDCYVFKRYQMFSNAPIGSVEYSVATVEKIFHFGIYTVWAVAPWLSEIHFQQRLVDGFCRSRKVIEQ